MRRETCDTAAASRQAIQQKVGGGLTFPDRAALQGGLRSACRDKAGPGPPARPTILRRRPNPYSSTYPSEIAQCAFGDGRTADLLCKYGDCRDGHHGCHGHRGGVRYEAGVYRQVLDQLPIAPLACYGSYIDARSGAAWLFLEFMRDAVHLNKEETVLESDLLVKAASWIGDFHRVAAANLGRLPVHRLKRYDGNYYDGWIERTLQYSLRCDRAYPWLRQLARDAPKALRRLADERITIIHGEYYPGNILVQAERVTPIDWETAAVAAGEIDLAMLTEGWPSELVRRCERAYGQARWPGKAEPELAERLILARFYLEFRWLGDRPEWTAKGLDQRFERLRRLGCQLRLI